MFIFGALGSSGPRKELKAMFKSIAEKRDYVTKLLKNADPEVVESIRKLPGINQDVLLLTYGLDGNEAMDDERIAKYISYNYDGIEITSSLVPFIREDAKKMLDMTDKEVEEFRFPKLDFEFGSSKLISWEDMVEMEKTLHNMEEITMFLEDKYDKESTIFLPSFTELYEYGAFNDSDYYERLKFFASAVYLALKLAGFEIKANISTGDVNLATVLDYSYLYFKFAKEIVIDSRKEALELC